MHHVHYESVLGVSGRRHPETRPDLHGPLVTGTAHTSNPSGLSRAPPKSLLRTNSDSTPSTTAQGSNPWTLPHLLDPTEKESRVADTRCVHAHSRGARGIVDDGGTGVGPEGTPGGQGNGPGLRPCLSTHREWVVGSSLQTHDSSRHTRGFFRHHDSLHGGPVSALYVHDPSPTT